MYSDRKQITGCQVGEQDGVLWGRVGEMTKGQKGSFESAVHVQYL